MKAQVDEHRQTRYLVELRRPRDGWKALEDIAARARGTAAELSASGTPLRFLRTVFVPEDESCYLLFEAPSADTAAEAARRAGLPVADAVAVGREED